MVNGGVVICSRTQSRLFGILQLAALLSNDLQILTFVRYKGHFCTTN